MAKALRTRLACFLLLLLLATGCRTGPAPSKVRGSVTLDGEPVEGAMVLLIPESGIGPSANAITLADGSFRLISTEMTELIPPGSYKVVITKPSATTPAQAMAKAQERANASSKPGFVPPSEEEELDSILPKRYGLPTKTPLRCQVPVEGPVEFDLKSKE